MDNVERGKLLAALFPDEVQGILYSLQQACQYMTENEEAIREGWDSGFFPFGFWQRIAANVAEALRKYDSRLTKSSSLFADQLFDGYNGMFTIDCILKQAKHSENLKYRQAVALLFD